MMRFDRADRARREEIRQARLEIQARDALETLPHWSERAPALLRKISSNPERALVVLAALRAAQKDPESDQGLIARVIADLEALIG